MIPDEYQDTELKDKFLKAMKIEFNNFSFIEDFDIDIFNKILYFSIIS